LILVQGFMGTAAVTALTLASAVIDRRRTVEEAARLREEFLSIATHELRTPVTSLMGYAQLAQRAVSAGQPELLPAMLGAIVRQSGRLSRLITHLLDVSRIESGQFRLMTQPTDLSALTATTVELARLADADRHRWATHIEAGIVTDVDPEKWEELIANLVENAVKYTAEGRTVTTSLERRPDGGVSLAVADDGTGIPADRLPFVFDRFYRARVDEAWAGLGLGLYIARQIAEGHDGRIDVISSAGSGTTFTVTLPAGRVGSTLPATVVTRPDREPQQRRRVRSVLVVEDEPDVAALAVEVLRSSGHAVRLAPDGRKALDAAIRDRPDVILLDKLMPVMDGTAFAQAYRAAVSDPAPIIAFCAARDAEDWARSVGAVACVAKPFDVDALAATIDAADTTPPSSSSARTASAP
jgi:CheY-like chemotaxis protein